MSVLGGIGMIVHKEYIEIQTGLLVNISLQGRDIEKYEDEEEFPRKLYCILSTCS